MCWPAKRNQAEDGIIGKTLEHFIFTELKAYLSYKQDTRPLYFWRSKSGYEVDFLVGDDIAIEVKAAEMVTERHLSGLKALSEEMTLRQKIVVSMDRSPRKLRGVDILPVKIFLQRLWNATLIA